MNRLILVLTIQAFGCVFATIPSCSFNENSQQVVNALNAAAASSPSFATNVVAPLASGNCGMVQNSLDSISYSPLGQLPYMVASLMAGGYATDLVYNHLGVLRLMRAKTSIDCMPRMKSAAELFTSDNGQIVRSRQNSSLRTQNTAFWLGGYAEFAHQNSQAGDSAFNVIQGGPLVAFDYSGFEDGIVGGAFTYGHTGLSASNNHSIANSYLLGAYGMGYIYDGYIELALWGSYNILCNKRKEVVSASSPLNDLIGTAFSSHHAWALDPHIALGYDFLFDTGTVEPFVNVDIAIVWEQEFDECGSAPVLWSVGSKNGELLRVEGGCNFYQDWKGGKGTFVLRETVSYVGRKSFQLGKETAAVLNTGGAALTTTALDQWQNLFSPGIEAFYKGTSGWFFSFTYKGEFFSGYASNEALSQLGIFF